MRKQLTQLLSALAVAAIVIAVGVGASRLLNVPPPEPNAKPARRIDHQIHATAAVPKRISNTTSNHTREFASQFLELAWRADEELGYDNDELWYTTNTLGKLPRMTPNEYGSCVTAVGEELLDSHRGFVDKTIYLLEPDLINGIAEYAADSEADGTFPSYKYFKGIRFLFKLGLAHTRLEIYRGNLEEAAKCIVACSRLTLLTRADHTGMGQGMKNTISDPLISLMAEYFEAGGRYSQIPPEVFKIVSIKENHKEFVQHLMAEVEHFKTFFDDIKRGEFEPVLGTKKAFNRWGQIESMLGGGLLTTANENRFLGYALHVVRNSMSPLILNEEYVRDLNRYWNDDGFLGAFSHAALGSDYFAIALACELEYEKNLTVALAGLLTQKYIEEHGSAPTSLTFAREESLIAPYLEPIFDGLLYEANKYELRITYPQPDKDVSVARGKAGRREPVWYVRRI